MWMVNRGCLYLASYDVYFMRSIGTIYRVFYHVDTYQVLTLLIPVDRAMPSKVEVQSRCSTTEYIL